MRELKAKAKPKAPPREPCVVICFATKVSESAERAKPAERQPAVFVGSILEGEGA